MKDKEKKNLLKKYHSFLILELGDKVLKDVLKETTTAGIWKKLKELYISNVMLIVSI